VGVCLLVKGKANGLKGKRFARARDLLKNDQGAAEKKGFAGAKKRVE